MMCKKLLSMMLSLTVLVGCFCSIPFTVSADVITGFTDLALDGGFDAESVDNWAISGSAEGSLSIVQDNSDAQNKVLRYDGSNNSKNISYIYYNKLESSKRLYFSVKARVASNDTNTGDMYLYANSLGIVGSYYYSATRPAISKNSWTECFGVYQSTSATTGFKIISTQKTSSTNVPKVIYEFDDFKVYDFTGCKITIPEGVSHVSGAFSVNGEYFAKSGDTVTLSYDGADKVLDSATAEITKDGTQYTFTKPASDTEITLVDPPKPPVPAFTNLFENGDMEGADVNWAKAGATTGCEIALVTDSENADNKVLSYKGQNVTAGTTSYMAYKDTVLEAATKYYYSYKIRMAADDSNPEPLYLYSNLNPAVSEVARPELSKSWTTRSGVFTNGTAAKPSFKIISDRSTSSTNVLLANYEVDDIVLYKMTDIYEITLPEQVTLQSGGKAVDITNSELETETKYYAEVGDEITLGITAYNELTSDEASLTKIAGGYTFTMPESDVTINKTEDITFGVVSGGPAVTVCNPKSFYVIATKYDTDRSLTSINMEYCTTETENEVIPLSSLDGFDEITDWNGMNIYIWDSLDSIKPLCKAHVIDDL